MVEALFKQFDGYLARQGYIARGGQILDASIVPVPCNHNSRDENAAIKKGELPEDWADKPTMCSQKDTDARWTRKHGKNHYGDKNHVNVDRKHKPVAALSRQRCGPWSCPCFTGHSGGCGLSCDELAGRAHLQP